MPRRAWLVLLAAALIAAPAVALRSVCAGRSCARAQAARAQAPFCSLPRATRELVRAGFYEGRSPEVLTVTRRPVAGGTAFAGRGPGWPRADEGPRRVPLVVVGPGVTPGSTLPDGMGLDDVAPTIGDIIELDRPHPEVRSGRAAGGLWAGPAPRLVVLVALRGVGTADLASLPHLRRLMREGAATATATPGALPADPAATLATIGTGGLPRQHGITGTLLRNDAGRLVRAGSRGSPVSVIATLADDLDRRHGERPRVGLVGASSADRGLIGSGWYVSRDRDDVVYVRRAQLSAAVSLVRAGYGDDGVPDLLTVAARGPASALDRGLRELAAVARVAAGGRAALVVTGTGSPRVAPDALGADEVVRELEGILPGARAGIEAVAPGGLFLDQAALSRIELDRDSVVDALSKVGHDRGGRVMADVFSAFAVSFARYC